MKKGTIRRWRDSSSLHYGTVAWWPCKHTLLRECRQPAKVCGV